MENNEQANIPNAEASEPGAGSAESANRAGAPAPIHVPDERESTRDIDYAAAAKAACDAGDDVLGMHLYLAAFETQSQQAYPVPDEAIDALRSAWNLAIGLKERSMAEYIFEKIEPSLSGQEMGEFADALQQLALDKLEQFGLSREELEDMAEAISGDFFDGPLGGGTVRIEQFTIPAPAVRESAEGQERDDSTEDPGEPDRARRDERSAAADATQVGDSESADAAGSSIADGRVDAIGAAETMANASASTGSAKASAKKPASAARDAGRKRPKKEKYADLVGFDDAIADMRTLGIGMGDSEDFKSFVAHLNEMYGVDRMPALDALILRADVHEDANKFLEATVNEIGLPVVRMAVRENLQGVPVLVVSSEGIDLRGRQNLMRMGFTQPLTLVLENIDLWPMAGADDDREDSFAPYTGGQGPREAGNIIRSAVENPDTYVLASAAKLNDIDASFFDLLAPASIVDIALPNDDERARIWQKILVENPSLDGIAHTDLVRLSSGMSRFDIEQAAREATEGAYRRSMSLRTYVPVSEQNIFEKLANYQPLDSSEYRDLEQKVLDDFRRDISNLDDLLGGDE